MKLSTILAITLVLIPLTLAANYTDTLTADFNTGNTTEVNTSNDQVALPLLTATEYNISGTFVSKVFDLGSNPASRTIAWSYSTPTNTSVLVNTRSGPSATPDSNWTSWSSNYATSSGSTITDTLYRYTQYRLQLTTTTNTSTPNVTSVVLSYVESGSDITLDASSDNVTSSSSGTSRARISVTDTLTILNVTARYRYDNSSNGTYSASSNLTLNGSYYDLDIPEPAAGWYVYNLGNLTIEVTATTTNGSTTNTTTTVLQDAIEFINTAPVIDPISNQTVLQGDELNITLTASDFDNHTLTFTTNHSAITVTALTSSSASLTWTTNGTDIGLNTITVTTNDGYTNATKAFNVTVTDTNDAPTVTSVPTSITGHEGVRQSFTITAYDPDTYQNLEFTVLPNFFTITATQNSSTWTGTANFTPGEPERGEHILTFNVSDGTGSDADSTTMTITYCGDNACQSSYEDESTCAIDCLSQDVIPQLSLIVPDRNCANTSMKLYVFNATERYSCYYQGLVEQGFALCEGIDGADIKIFLREGFKLTEKTTLSSGINGSATYTPPVAGEYKVVVTKDDFRNATAYITVRNCANDIVIKNDTITIEQPALPPIERKPEKQEPLPPLTEETASLLSIFIFYIIVPLLLAALLYTSIVFYDVNKDTLPWLLESRIWLYERRTEYDPQISKFKGAVKPYLDPVVDSAVELYNLTLKPIVDKLKNLRK